MSILTKSDIIFNELRLFRILRPDNTFKWYISVGYRVETTEGENYMKDKIIELTGTQITSAKNFLTNIHNQIKNEEGIT